MFYLRFGAILRSHRVNINAPQNWTTFDDISALILPCVAFWCVATANEVITDMGPTNHMKIIVSPPHCASSVCPTPVCVHAFGHAFYPVSMQEESSRLSYFLFHASPSLQCATTNASIFILLTKHWFLYTVGYYRDFFPIHFSLFSFRP